MARTNKPKDDDTASQETAAGTIPTTEWEQGFRGTAVDQTPNEAYTVAGVTTSTTAAEADNAAEEGTTPAADDPTP